MKQRPKITGWQQQRHTKGPGLPKATQGYQSYTGALVVNTTCLCE